MFFKVFSCSRWDTTKRGSERGYPTGTSVPAFDSRGV
jgi:hypothetical protein